MKTTQKSQIPKQVAEDETFWRHHVVAQAASEISKSAYCRVNKVNYPRFIYWSKKKAGSHAGGALVAVKLEPATPKVLGPTVLCTLTLKSGDCLHIYDERVLPIILEGRC